MEPSVLILYALLGSQILKHVIPIYVTRRQVKYNNVDLDRKLILLLYLILDKSCQNSKSRSR